jgi:1-deoxy-D-xylulose-5-phosphate synthase
MLHEALKLDGPSAIRHAKGAARRVPREEVGSGLKARRLREGNDVCLLAVGRVVEAAVDAADELASAGKSASVWDVRVVKPLDTEMLEDVARHPFVVTVEDGIRVGARGRTLPTR